MKTASPVLALALCMVCLCAAVPADAMLFVIEDANPAMQRRRAVADNDARLFSGVLRADLGRDRFATEL